MNLYLNWSVCEDCGSVVSECECLSEPIEEFNKTKYLEDLTGFRAMNQNEIREWTKWRIINLEINR